MQLYLSQIHLFYVNLFLKTRLLIRLGSREGGKCLYRKTRVRANFVLCTFRYEGKYRRSVKYIRLVNI